MAIGDLISFSEEEVRKTLILEFANHSKENNSWNDPPIVHSSEIEAQLKDLNILIALISTGDFGCNSSAFFLFNNRKENQLYTIESEHCSCFGFQGQWDLVETCVETLKAKKSYFERIADYGGGADYEKMIMSYLENYERTIVEDINGHIDFNEKKGIPLVSELDK